LLLGQGEGAFVLDADGVVKQPAVAQAHGGRDVAEQRHQRLQRAAGVDQRGGVGVAQLVAGDVPEPGCRAGAVEFGGDHPGGQAAAVVSEQELRGPAGARVRQRPAG